MTADDAEVFAIAASMVVVIGSTRALFAFDERRMTEAQRERAWPDATRGVITISPLFFPLWIVGVPLHFVRTRRTLRGVLEGVIALFAVYAAAVVANVLVAIATGTAW